MPLTDKSYATIAQADEYWSDLNDSEWSDLDEPVKSAGLIRASEYIYIKFSGICAVDEYDDIPQQLINATSWLAKYATGELQPPQSRGGDIKSVSAGSVEVVWNDFAPTGTTYDHVKDMLKDLTGGLKMRKA